MYVLEFQSSLDGNDRVFVDESKFVDTIFKIIATFRKDGYYVSGSFHKTAKKFVGEYEFKNNSEVVSMCIV